MPDFAFIYLFDNGALPVLYINQVPVLLYPFHFYNALSRFSLPQVLTVLPEYSRILYLA